VDALNREGGRTLANGGTGLFISPRFSEYGWVVLPFIGCGDLRRRRLPDGSLQAGVDETPRLIRFLIMEGGSPYAPSPCMGAEFRAFLIKLLSDP